MTIEFTKHPILESPTDEEIVILGEADPKLLASLHEAHGGGSELRRLTRCVMASTYQGGTECGMLLRTTMR